MRLVILFLMAFSNASSAFDIIGTDNRRPLTEEEKIANSFVGRLNVKTLTNWQGWNDIPRCSVTLVSEKLAITDASCFIMSSILARKEVREYKTKEEYISHFVKHREDYSVVFKSPQLKKISIRTIHFSSDFNPALISQENGSTHIFRPVENIGLPLLILDLETDPEINPISPYNWRNGEGLGDDVSVSVISYGLDNRTLLIDPKCNVTNDHEDNSGLYFQNSCDDISVDASPVILSHPSGVRSLRGINITGQYLRYLRSKNPEMEQDEVFKELDKACGELSPHCINTAVSGSTIFDRINKILPSAHFLDNLSKNIQKECSSRVIYNHLVNQPPMEKLYLLCSREEMLELKSSSKELREILETDSAFKNRKTNEMIDLLSNEARKEKAVLNGEQIPANFVLNESLFKEVVSTKAFTVFKNLHTKGLLSENQILAFMQGAPETLSLQLAYFGREDFLNKLNILAKKYSPLFSDTLLWTLFEEQQISPKSLQYLQLRDLSGRYRVPLSIQKKFYSLEELKNAFTYRELVSLVGMSHEELIASGVNYRSYCNQFSPRMLRDNGGDLSKFKSSGIEVYDLLQDNFSAQDLKRTGYTLNEVIKYSSASKAKNIGYNIIDFKNAKTSIAELESLYSKEVIKTNFTFVELYERRATIEKLKNDYFMSPVEAKNNFKIEQIYPAFSVKELYDSGVTLVEFRSLYCKLNYNCDGQFRYGGYGPPSVDILNEFEEIKIPAALLDEAGFSSKDILYACGWDLKVIKSLNKTIVEYYRDGFEPDDLVRMGFSKRDVKRALKAAGYDIGNSEF